MKRIFLAMLITVPLLLACSEKKGFTELTATRVLGIMAFNICYNQYSMLSPYNTETLMEAMEGVTVEIYFGDWDMKSVNNVGAFIRILRTISYDESKARFFNVAKEPEKRTQIEKEKHLSGYPTFIFFRKNKEFGRIIGGQQSDLEDNLIRLLTRE